MTINFILELPDYERYDNILVIVDKLTKYTIFIPTTTTIIKKELLNSFSNKLFPNMVYLGRSYQTRTLDGKENFGRRFVIEWE